MSIYRKVNFDSVYVDPFTDEGFKIIFGTEGKSEEILRGFLNQLMNDDPLFGNKGNQFSSFSEKQAKEREQDNNI